MYIKTANTDLKRISIPEMEGEAEFSENNIAQVTEADGEALLDKYPDTFTEHETD